MRSGLAIEVIAAGVVLSILYFASSVFIVILVSAFLAILLDPLVVRLERLGIARSIGASVMVAGLLLILCVPVVFLYDSAEEFARELPRYSRLIQTRFAGILQGAQEVGEQVGQIIGDEGGPEPVEVVDRTSYLQYLFPGVMAVYDFLVAGTLLPFVLFFTLTWKEHLRRRYLDIFDEEARDEVARSLIAMVTVLRRFFYGNIMVGLILSAACLALFLPLGLPYPYFLGLFSGFITLIPYLGAVLAISVPLLPALEHFGSSAAFGVLLAGLLIIHLVGFNLLLSKMVGSMIHLNPLVATVALLVWSWMWGAMGLILAMPIVAADKAVCDNVPSLRPYGRLLGTW